MLFSPVNALDIRISITTRNGNLIRASSVGSPLPHRDMCRIIRECIAERDLIRASSVGIRLTHKLDVTLENGFFEMSSYFRANVRLIYEKTKGQSLDLHWENKYTS